MSARDKIKELLFGPYVAVDADYKIVVVRPFSSKNVIGLDTCTMDTNDITCMNLTVEEARAVATRLEAAANRVEANNIRKEA